MAIGRHILAEEVSQLMNWDYDGEFLKQFPAHLRGAIGNEFCVSFREGNHTPETLLIGIALKFERTMNLAGEQLMRVDVLASEGALDYANFIIARENLPWPEKQKLKDSRDISGYVKSSMAQQPPTEKQLNYLHNLGCTEIPKSKLEASEWIEAQINGKVRQQAS